MPAPSKTKPARVGTSNSETDRTDTTNDAEPTDILVIMGTTTCPLCRTDKFAQDKVLSEQIYNGKLLVAHARRCTCGHPYLYKTSQPAPPAPPAFTPKPRPSVETVDRPSGNAHQAPVQYFPINT